MLFMSRIKAATKSCKMDVITSMIHVHVSHNVIDLRKQARHLENEIDAKLVAFSKLGINAGARHVNVDEVPLLDEEHVFENMASEIETLLSKVSSFYSLLHPHLNKQIC